MILLFVIKRFTRRFCSIRRMWPRYLKRLLRIVSTRSKGGSLVNSCTSPLVMTLRHLLLELLIVLGWIHLSPMLHKRVWMKNTQLSDRGVSSLKLADDCHAIVGEGRWNSTGPRSFCGWHQMNRLHRFENSCQGRRSCAHFQDGCRRVARTGAPFLLSSSSSASLLYLQGNPSGIFWFSHHHTSGPGGSTCLFLWESHENSGHICFSNRARLSGEAYSHCPDKRRQSVSRRFPLHGRRKQNLHTTRTLGQTKRTLVETGWWPHPLIIDNSAVTCTS